MFLYAKTKKDVLGQLRCTAISRVSLVLGVSFYLAKAVFATEVQLAGQGINSVLEASDDVLYDDGELQEGIVAWRGGGDDERTPELMRLESGSLVMGGALIMAPAASWARGVPAIFAKAGKFMHQGVMVLVLGLSAGVAVVASVWRISSEEDDAWGALQHTHSSDLLQKGGGGGPSQEPSSRLFPALPPDQEEGEDHDVSSPQSLHELEAEADSLEQDLQKAHREEKLLERILQFRLKTYAYRSGIAVDEIPQRVSSMISSEVRSQHITQLSDLSQERLMSLLEGYAEQDFSANPPATSQSGGGKAQQLRKYFKWVAGTCGVGFVCLLFL